MIIYEMQKFVCSNNSEGIELEIPEGLGNGKFGNCPNSLHKSKWDFLHKRLFRLDPGNVKILSKDEERKKITFLLSLNSSIKGFLVKIDRERHRKRFVKSRFYSKT